MNTPAPKRTSLLAILGATALVFVGGYFGVNTGENQDAPQGSCAVASLPAEAKEVIADILEGGPYSYPGEDGKHFGNFEGHLPQENSNYYRSFTVDTPGLHHRGERRIVVGGGTSTDPEVWYYTSDHYGSFCEIPNAEE